MNKLPVILAILLYLLIYFLRYQQARLPDGQGGWAVNIDLFKSQRQVLDQKISELLPSPQAELLSGILLGQSKNLPGKLKLALRDTSTLHIVVASGQNLTILAAFFLSLAGLIKRKTALILSLVTVLLYTLLSGMQIPILRAAIMFSLASLAQFTGRQSSGFWVLLITASLMLWIDPYWITDLSFQLSLLATFGVIVISPVLLKWLYKLPIIGQDLAVTLAAQLMVTPIIAQNFHQFSLVSLAANVLILWIIPFLMVAGIVMLLLGFVWTMAGTLAAIGVNALLTYFIYIVQFFSSLPFAWEYVSEQGWVVWAGYYILLTGIMLLLNNAKTKNY